MTPTRISPEVLNGIFALSGAIVGALIGGIPLYLLERRRDRRDEKREKKARQTAVKQAARVVDAELEQAERSAQIAVDRGEWWAKEIGPLDVGSWNQYRAILASELPLDEWRLIASAFGFIHGINSAWAIAFRPPQIARHEAISFDPPRGGEPMVEVERKRIPYAIGWITKARQCLAKLLLDES